MVVAEVREVAAPELETVTAETSIRATIERMLKKNYSQLGITRGGQVTGTVSFQSIARTLIVAEELFDDPKDLGDRPVETAVEQPRVVEPDDSLTELFELLGDRSYVIVEDPDGPVKIITDFDLRPHRGHRTSTA